MDLVRSAFEKLHGCILTIQIEFASIVVIHCKFERRHFLSNVWCGSERDSSEAWGSLAKLRSNSTWPNVRQPRCRLLLVIAAYESGIKTQWQQSRAVAKIGTRHLIQTKIRFTQHRSSELKLYYVHSQWKGWWYWRGKCNSLTLQSEETSSFLSCVFCTFFSLITSLISYDERAF